MHRLTQIATLVVAGVLNQAAHAAPPEATMAIITQDQTHLRAAPRDGAQQQAVLTQGEVVEVRGDRLDYVQVWDHRRERGGYVRASQLRRTALNADEAPELLGVARHLRDTGGHEALGIALISAYLKAAPAKSLNSETGAEALDALGTFAERLARRSSSASGKPVSNTPAAYLEVAALYGVKFHTIEREGGMQLCYDGEAHQRVLALSADAPRRARAALALTRPDCVNPALKAHERAAVNQLSAALLDKVETAGLPGYLKNRVHIQRAALWSSIAFAQTRKGANPGEAARRAQNEFALIAKGELPDDDQALFNNAAMRVNASRWAALPVVAMPSAAKAPNVVTAPGQTGETCVLLMAADSKAPLLRRCIYGVVWANSVSTNREGTAITVAVQPLEAWRELWLLRKTAEGWVVNVLPPAPIAPELGYAEFAGWVPGGTQMLVAREARGEGKYKRSFEVVRLDGLTTERQASEPAALGAFQRWQDAAWVKLSASVR